MKRTQKLLAFWARFGILLAQIVTWMRFIPCSRRYVYNVLFQFKRYSYSYIVVLQNLGKKTKSSMIIHCNRIVSFKTKKTIGYPPWLDLHILTWYTGHLFSQFRGRFSDGSEILRAGLLSLNLKLRESYWNMAWSSSNLDHCILHPTTIWKSTHGWMMIWMSYQIVNHGYQWCHQFPWKKWMNVGIAMS